MSNSKIIFLKKSELTGASICRALNAPLHHFGVILSLTILFLLDACQFAELRNDLAEMDQLATIYGTVSRREEKGDPIILAITRDEFRRDALFDVRVIDPKGFKIRLPSGDYYAFAWEDTKRDFRYEFEEPAGFFGAPTKIELQPATERRDISISLSPNLVMPEGSLDRPSDQAAMWSGRRNVGAEIALDDPRFAPELAKIGLWQPLRFSLEPGPGVFFLGHYTADKKPVLFVHGIGGTPRDLAPIMESLDQGEFQAWVYSYASGLPLETNARYLLDAIRQLRLQYRFHHMSIVAHSMGGLVAQAFLDLHRPGEASYVDTFITISTPWGGHDAARVGTELSPVVAPVWRDMAPGSPFLTNLGRSDRAQHLRYALLFGFHGGAFPSSTANDGTVTLATQLEWRAQRRASWEYGFDAGHTDILERKDVQKLVGEILENSAAPVNKVISRE